MSAERRRSMRVEVTARAAVYSPAGPVWSCEVENLSLGGACLEGTRAHTRVGDEVRIGIRFPGARTIRPRGRVARVRAVGGRVAVAVQFASLSPDAEDCIENACLAALERELSPRVLVVDPDGFESATLARCLRDAGHRVVAVPTPLHAVAYLQESESRVTAIVVHLDLSQTTGAELLRYVSEEHPQVRRVAVASTARRNDALALVASGVACTAITTEDSGGNGHELRFSAKLAEAVAVVARVHDGADGDDA